MSHITDRISAAVTSRLLHAQSKGDEGMTTAEYGIGTVAASALAGCLYAAVKMPTVQDWLKNLFKGLIAKFV